MRKWLVLFVCLWRGHMPRECWGHRRLSWFLICDRCGKSLDSAIGKQEVTKRTGFDDWR